MKTGLLIHILILRSKGLSNYIFDLDGTLIDSSERMYQVFCKLIPESKLSKEEYWKYKRNMVSHKMLIELLYPSVEFKQFNTLWLSKIEEESYLAMDQKYPDTMTVLSQLKFDGHNLYLLTARQSKKNLMDELQHLGLIIFFDKILSTEGIYSKEYILNSYAKVNVDILNPNNIFISDMGKDLQMAKKYGFYTIAISHGFMKEDRLVQYAPDKIVSDLSELL